MSKTKKILIAVGLFLDLAITVFFFVISIIMIVKATTMPAAEWHKVPGLIGYLINNLTVYLCGFVIPMFLLLAANIVGLVMYIKRSGAKKQKLSVNDLSEEQKEALKKELLKDLENK